MAYMEDRIKSSRLMMLVEMESMDDEIRCRARMGSRACPQS